MIQFISTQKIQPQNQCQEEKQSPGRSDGTATEELNTMVMNNGPNLLMVWAPPFLQPLRACKTKTSQEKILSKMKIHLKEIKGKQIVKELELKMSRAVRENIKHV